MTTYRIEATGDVREVYHVEAESEEEAREMFLRGDVGQPTISEASTAIDSIHEDPA